MSSSEIPSLSLFSGIFFRRKLLANPQAAIEKECNSLGEIFRFEVSGCKFTVVNSPKLIKHLFAENPANYLAISDHAPITGFLADEEADPESANQRALLTDILSAFMVPDSLSGFYPIIEEEIEQLKENYFTTKNSSDKINIELEMHRLLIKVIARGMLAPGLEINADSMQEAMTDIAIFNNMENLIKIRARSGFLPGKSRIKQSLPKHISEAFHYLEELTDHIGADFMGIKAERSQFLEQLHLYLRAHNTEYQKVIELIKEAFYTTSIPMGQAVTWCLHYVNNIPGLRKLIEAELQTTNAADYRPENLPVLTGALLETMRLKPSHPFIHRFANSADSMHEYWVKENSWMLISPRSLHTNKNLWTSSEFSHKSISYDAIKNGQFDYKYFPIGHILPSSPAFQFMLSLMVRVLADYLSALRVQFYDKNEPQIKDASVALAKGRMLVRIEQYKV